MKNMGNMENMESMIIMNICGYDKSKDITQGVILKIDKGYIILWINRGGLPEYYIKEEHHKYMIGKIILSFGKRNQAQMKKQILKKTIDVIFK